MLAVCACLQSRETVKPWIMSSEGIAVDKSEASAFASFARLSLKIWKALVSAHRVARYRNRAICTNVFSSAGALSLEAETIATAVSRARHELAARTRFACRADLHTAVCSIKCVSTSTPTT
jgi:hypothetical protein